MGLRARFAIAAAAQFGSNLVGGDGVADRHQMAGAAKILEVLANGPARSFWSIRREYLA